MGKRVIGWMVLASLVLAGSASAELVGYWRLDDGAGTTAVDSSGNGHDGALIGNPQWAEEGVFGGALSFAGSPDKVDVPYSAQLNPATEFSATVWANVDPGGSGHRSPITSRDDYPQRGYIIYVEPGNTWQYWIGVGSGWNNTAGPAVDLGEWTHVAITYLEGEKKFYINGELVAEGSGEISTNTAQVLRIGAGATEGDGNYFFVGLVDDVALFDHALSQAEVLDVMDGIAPEELAANPSPANEEEGVLRDVVLGWDPGVYAAAHDVYLGTSFDDVNDASRTDARDVLVSQDQSDATYDAGRLEFGQTYYWRVDEVNAAPDSTIFKGDVWSFAVEPLAYPITDIVATSNGDSEADEGPENTVNGSGLDAADQHSVESGDMWVSYPAADGSLWIQYEFDAVYKLHEMLVWNYNVQFESLLGFGVKNAIVEYSEDGANWTALGDVEFVQATGTVDYTANSTVEFGGVPARYVRIDVNGGFGTMGKYGLSEVRFMYIPVQGRKPEPADGATEVAVDTELSWRAGREAVSHEVYLSDDADAVAGGTALVDTVTDSGYAPSDLEFGNTYYWKVAEVNEAEAVSSWAGSVWSFTVQEYGLIEDFEAYDDDLNRIYDTWIDGWINGTASVVGYATEPFAEQVTIHGGRQSMPLEYDNSIAPYYSETSRTWASAQDWTAGGAVSLRLHFHGAADNEAETLYVAIEDASSNVAVVTNEDPNAALATSWQTWTISFSTLTAAGVNVTAVETMYVGLGDRDNPSAGGAGIIYVDDIALGTPLAYRAKGDVTAAGDAIQGVPNDGDWPGAETPDLAIDDDTGTKYLHFKGETEPTGFQVTPSIGATIVTELTLTTANDAVERDPIAFELYGSNEGLDGPYTLIASGDVVDFAGEAEWPRYTTNETPMTFDNDVAYQHYQLLFPSVRDAGSANSMQIAEVELIGVVAP